MKKVFSVLLAAALLLAGCAQGGGEAAPAAEADPIDDNFRSFYQVFVGSFSDSNGDGIGDLRGLINRLDYLNDGNIHSATSLGVQGLWLSPIFPSPSYHKYDAKDYYSIDWRFGSLEDLQELVDKCHERNVKVILDLAINHAMFYFYYTIWCRVCTLYPLQISKLWCNFNLLTTRLQHMYS